VMSALWQDRTELQKLSPDRFEHLVAEIFQRLGYEVALTQFVRDGGVDLVAVGGSDKSKKRFLVQCKRYAPANRFAVELVKSARPIHINLKDGQAHVVTTCSFLVPQESGKASERLTSSRWEISPMEWDSVKTWIAPFIKVSEPPLNIDHARDRYAELVDKKFGSYLTEAEQAELLRLRAYLTEAESGFYEPIKKRLDLALAKLNSPIEG
jgi:restriction endonuclease Mrr